MFVGKSERRERKGGVWGQRGGVRGGRGGEE